MKQTLLVFGLLICAIGASAQKYWDGSRPDEPFTFGARVGANASKQYSMDDFADRDFRLGYQVGVTADINVVRSFSINTGVILMQKGWKWDYEDKRGKKEVTDNATYLEIPVLASYRINLSDQAQFQLNLGPYFAFGIWGDQEVKNSFPNGDNYKISSFAKIEGGKKFDCGVSIGAGFSFTKFFVGLNYERGLVNVSRDNDKKFQNGSIALSLGYNF